jgi:hypothetical protein
MEKVTSNNYPATIEDLIDKMQSGQYKHLQIFLYRDEPHHRFDMGERYLVVNTDGFAL